MRKIKNLIFQFLVYLGGAVAITPCLLIFIFLIKNGIHSLSWDFFSNTAKPIGENHSGMLQAILGSVLILGLAIIISIPLGIIFGFIMTEYKNLWISRSTKIIMRTLNSLPSIVVGIVVYLVFVAPIRSYSLLAGSIALSIIMIPMISLTAREIFNLYPQDLKTAGAALGMQKYQIIFHLIIKGQKGPLLTTIILAISRAAGETAPLLFTSLGNMHINYHLTAPTASLPIQIYQYATSPYSEWQQMAWTGALVLVLFITSLNLMAKLFSHKRR